MNNSKWISLKRSVEFWMLAGTMLAAGLVLLIPVIGYAVSPAWREGCPWGLYLLFAVCSMAGICMGAQMVFWNGVAVRGDEIRLRKGGLLPREYLLHHRELPSVKLEHRKKKLRYGRGGSFGYHAYRLTLCMENGREYKSNWLQPDLDAMRDFMNRLPPKNADFVPNDRDIAAGTKICWPFVALNVLPVVLGVAGLV